MYILNTYTHFISEFNKYRAFLTTFETINILNIKFLSPSMYRYAIYFILSVRPV